ncbi:MAG TPA: sigma-70 family RNA polymerase sigma factor, partial [Anseongella sp.]|nr:sigma-70 family RNA polymerase sigma factor [Anseongella sp.]
MNDHVSAAEGRGALFFRLYESVFPAVAGYVARHGGSLDQAKDIFQDALIIYYEKTRSASFSVEQDPESYIFGICRNRWNKAWTEGARTADELFPEAAAGETAPAPSEKKLHNLLETAGKKCMELLKGFYYDQLTLQELAGLLGFSGTRSATVQKFKCLEKVRNTVKEKSLS